MDTLDVLHKAQDLGGEARREAMMRTFLMARKMGCDVSTGGGQIGGFNVRYGTLKYAILDMNTRGEVFFHIKHHPDKDLPADKKTFANQFITDLEGITIKNAPINHYGQAEQPIETIPEDSVHQFLEYAIKTIRESYY